MTKGTVLIVDDDEFFRKLHADIVRNGGYDVIVSSSGKEAIEIVKTAEVDVVITDFIMADLNGQEVLEQSKQHNALIEVIIVTSHGTIESAIAALKSGAFDYLRKPVNEDELILSVNRCYDQKQLVQENYGLRQSLKLFKVSRTIASCLEFEKLYHLTLDALLQEIPGDAGLGLFFNKDLTKLEVKAAKHFEPIVAEQLASLVLSSCRRNPALFDQVGSHPIEALNIDGKALMNGYASVVIAPLKKESQSTGFLFILSRSPASSYSDLDIENAAFIAEQASLSFENAEKYASAKALAYVDSLTDLYNPRFLDISIEKEIGRSNRTGIPFTVLFMDLDYFKAVNDEHGHIVGSKVLVEVSLLLLKCVREVDYVIRYGGDEYTVVLVDTDHKTAFNVADRIRKTIQAHTFLEDENMALKVTASIGLATYPTHAGSKRELLDMADKAMYYGKNRSRNTVYIAEVDKEKE